MPAQEGIHIRGMGLSCALGEDLPACAEAMEAGVVKTLPLTLDALIEPVHMRYYRIPDDAPLFARERLDRIMLQTMREAVRGADLSRAELERMPLFIGSSCFSVGKSEAEYMALLQSLSSEARPLPYIGFDQLARTIQRELGCSTETYSFNTACTAGANALMIATRMIRLGIHENALVLGVELANQTTLAGFSGLQLVADAVRPFDRRRSGIVLGEGVGAVLLSATKAQSSITVVAAASNCDSYSVTAANPDGSTIAAVQTSVLRQAGVEPGKVRGIKSHGTASPLNDTGEAAGIRRVFAKPPPVCALKPFVGHTLGACGVNELILMASALERGFFPGTPGFEEEDPELGLSPARENGDAPSGHYMLNYFGFGGNNTSLLVHKS